MRNTPVKFVAIMPNEDTSLESYISSMTYLEYSDMLDSFKITSLTNASVPEFSIKSDGKPTSLKSELEDFALRIYLPTALTFQISLFQMTFS